METRQTIKLLTVAAIFLFFTGNVHGQQFNVMVFTKTMIYHHTSIPEGVDAIKELAKKHYFDVEWHEISKTAFTDKNLAKYDAIIFLNTSGDILNEEEQVAFKKFIQSGKGFVGIHCAASTESEWDWYAKLVGRLFVIHPVIQTGKLKVEDNRFPGMETFPKERYWTEEWYEFGKENVEGLNYLLSVDENTFDPNVNWGARKGNGMGEFHPLAWYHEYDGGRSFYTALGHLPACYMDAAFLDHIYGGIYWAAKGKGLD